MYVCISCTIRAFLMHSGCSRRVPMAVNLPVRRSTLLLLLSLHNCICCCYCCCCSCLEHLWSALAKGSESAAVVGALCLCCLAICNIYIRVYLFPSFFYFVSSARLQLSAQVPPRLAQWAVVCCGWVCRQRDINVTNVPLKFCFCLLSISICFFTISLARF